MTAWVKEQAGEDKRFDWNEIAFYREHREISANSAVAKILAEDEFIKSYFFSLHVIVLPVHLPGDDPVIIRGVTIDDFLRAAESEARSKLEAFFRVVRDERLHNIVT